MSRDTEHSQNSWAFFHERRFFPMFLTQFFGAFNDNIFKQAIIILITFSLADRVCMGAGTLVTLASGLFILPFFIFSAVAGQIADHHDKAILIRRLKVTELCIMLLSVAAFMFESVPLLMAALFCMGIQSSFFGPLKYSILADHLGDRELLAGNGLFSASTFIAILIGTIVGGAFIMRPFGLLIISCAVVAVAVLGYVSSRFIPPAMPKTPDTGVDWNIIRSGWRVVQRARKNSDAFTAILGISWFWCVGFIMLAQIPDYAKTYLGVNADVVTLILTIFSLGVGLGSMLCNRILKGAINMSLAPFGAFMMALSLLIISTLQTVPSQEPILRGLDTVLNDGGFLTTLGLLFVLAVSAGVYAVPMYAVLQHRVEDAVRARMIAANNIMNALFMVVATVTVMGLLSFAVTIPQIFLIVGLLNAIVALLFSRRKRRLKR